MKNRAIVLLRQVGRPYQRKLCSLADRVSIGSNTNRPSLIPMSIIDKLAEQQILKAQERGDFDNLPGHGKPLQLDDDSMVPEALRAGYRLLKNSGYLPPELQLGKEIKEVEQLLGQISEPSQKLHAERRLQALKGQLGEIRGNRLDWAAERQYREQLLNSLEKR